MKVAIRAGRGKIETLSYGDVAMKVFVERNETSLYAGVGLS